MPDKNPEISILVVTHNQRALLKRCLESVVAQEIHVPYEIIVSDDGEEDGTEAMVRELGQAECVTCKDCLQGILYVRCDSSAYAHSPKGSRVGYNKLSAYLRAKGKYFVLVDADDFLVGTSLYQSEYEMLEKHPACSFVQTRTLKLDKGASLDDVYVGFPHSDKFVTGRSFTLEEYLTYGLRGLAQSCMYRRRPQDDMRNALGARFNDVFITYYHLQFGPMIFLDITGYIWVQYPDSVSHRLDADEKKVYYGLIPLLLSIKFKRSRWSFLRQGAKRIYTTLATAPKYPVLSDSSREKYGHFDAFIYRFYAEEHHSLFSYARFWVAFTLLRLTKRLNLRSDTALRVLYTALV